MPARTREGCRFNCSFLSDPPRFPVGLASAGFKRAVRERDDPFSDSGLRTFKSGSLRAEG